ncbi:MAG: heavy-metal-associated domain-containing protein [Clostridiales bacterium]|nr:heavy-metal-associated domain-containing protein [Clostridiales bacterium]
MAMELVIRGMTCQHCVQTVKKALSGVPGVTNVEVSLEEEKAWVEGDAPLEALAEAVKKAGYEVVSHA